MAEQEIEVGDRVSYVTDKSDPDSDWLARTHKAYAVISMYDGGRGPEAHCIEVTPMGNRHNRPRIDRFYAPLTSLRLVAKATYTPVE